MKIFNTEVDKWQIGTAVVILAAIVIVFLSVPKSCSKPVDTQQIINDAKVVLEKQYTTQLADKDKQIVDAKSRLTISEGRYATLVQKYVDLERRKKDVKAPTTNAELRDRFTALGYPPLAAQ